MNTMSSMRAASIPDAEDTSAGISAGATDEAIAKETLGDMRRKKGLTQAELAREAGIAAVTVRKLEQGAAIPNLRTLQALEKVLGNGVLSCDYGSPSALRPGRPKGENKNMGGI